MPLRDRKTKWLSLMNASIVVWIRRSTIIIPQKTLPGIESQSHNTTRESMPSQKNRKKLMQIFPTRMCNVTAWRQSRLRAHWLMTLVEGGWGGIPRELQRLLSLIGYGSTGGVSGRSLTVRKILFTWRQTCSLYFVLWLCGLSWE